MYKSSSAIVTGLISGEWHECSVSSTNPVTREPPKEYTDPFITEHASELITINQLFLYLPPGFFWGRDCHAFRRSLSHLEEIDYIGNHPTGTEAYSNSGSSC